MSATIQVPALHQRARLVYAYDFRLAMGDDGVRVLNFPYELWKDRYLSVFGSIHVIGRPFTESEEKALPLPISSGPGVSFSTVADLAHPMRQLVGRKEASEAIAGHLQEADLLIARLPSETGQIAAETAERLSIPWVAEVVACPFDLNWYHGSLKGKLWAPIAQRRMKRALAAAPRAVYVTKEALQRKYPAAGPSIACSNVALPPLDAAHLERRLEGIGQAGPRRIGLIGFLGASYKGADTAIRALAALDDVDVTLELVGDGAPESLHQLARSLGVAERVTFLGQLPHEEALAWLDTIQLYIQPSKAEGLPRALIEAMSRGCPAFASTAGGMGELLPAGELHAPGDHSGLAALLSRGLADPGWQRRAAKRNFETAGDYQASKLQARRRSFLVEAAASVSSPIGSLGAAPS